MQKVIKIGKPLPKAQQISGKYLLTFYFENSPETRSFAINKKRLEKLIRFFPIFLYKNYTFVEEECPQIFKLLKKEDWPLYLSYKENTAKKCDIAEIEMMYCDKVGKLFKVEYCLGGDYPEWV